MKIDNVKPISFGAGVNIIASENKAKPFLYNEIQAITKEFRIPANFKTTEIQLPSVTKEILMRLKSLNITYKEAEFKS